MIDLTDYKNACNDVKTAAENALPALQGLPPMLELAHEALLDWIGPVPDPSPAPPAPARSMWVLRGH